MNCPLNRAFRASARASLEDLPQCWSIRCEEISGHEDIPLCWEPLAARKSLVRLFTHSQIQSIREFSARLGSEFR
jgi:hypothetical protein